MIWHALSIHNTFPLEDTLFSSALVLPCSCIILLLLRCGHVQRGMNSSRRASIWSPRIVACEGHVVTSVGTMSGCSQQHKTIPRRRQAASIVSFPPAPAASLIACLINLCESADAASAPEFQLPRPLPRMDIPLRALTSARDEGHS